MKTYKTNLKIWIVLLVLAVIATNVTAQQILLYDDNTNNHHAKAALDSLSLPYTVGNSSTFNSLLEGSSWDLVVVDCPSSTPSGWTPLVNYINSGGRAIMSFWTLQSEPILAAAFDVGVNYSFDSPKNIYRWNAEHPIFNIPNPVGNLTSWDNLSWADDGDALSLIPASGAQALAGFIPFPVNNEAAIVLGNGGRTIYNGFLFDQLNAPASVDLIANEIMYVIPEPATLVLLGIGALALRRHSGQVLSRRKRNS